MKWITFGACVLVASIANAELSDIEKAEVRKLYLASAYASDAARHAIAGHQCDPTSTSKVPIGTLGGLQSSLFEAVQYLWGVPTGAVGFDFYQIPRAVLVERALLILHYWDSGYSGARAQLEGVTGAPCYLARINIALASLDNAKKLKDSFDVSLPYADPLSGIRNEPQTQFGPHGWFELSMLHLGEARRLLSYSIAFYWRDAYLNQNYKIDWTAGEFVFRITEAMDTLFRASALAMHTYVNAADADDSGSTVRRALKELDLINSGGTIYKQWNGTGVHVAFAGNALTWIIGTHKEYPEIVQQGVNASAVLMGGWKHIHIYLNSFLMITQVPVP